MNVDETKSLFHSIDRPAEAGIWNPRRTGCPPVPTYSETCEDLDATIRSAEQMLERCRTARDNAWQSKGPRLNPVDGKPRQLSAEEQQTDMDYRRAKAELAHWRSMQRWYVRELKRDPSLATKPLHLNEAVTSLPTRPPKPNPPSHEITEDEIPF